MGLLDLPNELLLQIPQHLHNLETFNDLSSTCRELRSILSTTSPNTVLHLASASSRIFFRPSPHFLVAATARQISNWALESGNNYESLRLAFQGGMDSLLELCVRHCGLSMDDIRRLHSCRSTIINPASDMIDRCAGKQWYEVEDFWDGGRSDAATISVEPERSVFQIIIYGELFGWNPDATHEPNSRRLHFDLDFRLDFIKYCIPDYMCWIGYDGRNGSLGMHVLPVGPYTPCKRIDLMTPAEIEAIPETHREYLQHDTARDLTADQVGLNHILTCRTWREAWEGVRRQIGVDFEEEWRQTYWHAAVQQQGLEGFEMLRPGGVEKWRSRLERIRNGVERMEKPKVYHFGRSEMECSDVPCMADEVLVCMAGMWPGSLAA